VFIKISSLQFLGQELLTPFVSYLATA